MSPQKLFNTIGNRRSTGKAAVALLSMTVVLCLCSCRGRPDPRTAKQAGIRREYQRGPVTVVVDADRSEITTADRLSLAVEVTAAEEYSVQMPDPTNRLDQFSVVDCRTAAPELADGNKTRTRRVFTLEPFLPGEYVIPPLRIGFAKKGESPHELETAEMRVTVKSVIPGLVTQPQIREIAPPVRLPGGNAAWLWAAAAVLVAAGALAWFLFRRGKTLVPQAVVPPDEIALRELDRLVAEDLVARGETKLFYQRVSDILRRYIESRFGLHAPEQTTEEFLADIRESRRLSEKYHPLLETFLVHCDMVKFAEYQPDSVEIGRTVDSCRTFIVHTAVSGAEQGADEAGVGGPASVRAG